MTQATQNQRQRLRQQLEKHLDLAAIRSLCFNLAIDFENLAGTIKSDKILSLIMHCERQNQLPQLLAQLRLSHPQVNWQLTHSHDPNNPYKGLFAFQEEDADRFFGRDEESERLEETVLENRFTAVIGSSGSGKSSLVFAGLVPRLRRRGNWSIAHLRPEKAPFHSLANALVPLLQPDTDSINRPPRVNELAGYLRDGTALLADYVRQIRAAGDHFLLIIDQFEELYTQVSNSKLREDFLDLLLAALTADDDHTPTLLLTMRADFMGQALGYPPFVTWLQDNDFLLGSMGREALQQTIEQPVAATGVQFEAGLVTRILDDIGNEPGNLPLLQFGLTQLWGWQEVTSEAAMLTHAGYEAIGRVEGALATHADAIFGGLDAASQDQARHIFTQLVQPGAGTEDTRRLARRSDLTQAEWSLVQRLANERLLVTGKDGHQQETIELVHEALIRQWQTLHTWMTEDRLFRSWQERLRDTIRLWEINQQDEGYLLRGTPLAEAENWLLERVERLTAVETNFIVTGIQLREQQATLDEEQRQHELEIAQQLNTAITERAAALEQQAKLEAKTSKRLRRFLIVSLVLLTISIFTTTLATQQSRLATARGLKAQANLELTQENDPHTAALLALEANKLSRGEGSEIFPQIYRQSRDAIFPEIVLENHSNIVFDAAWSPQEKYLASASLDGLIIIWDGAKGIPLTTLRHHSVAVTRLAWSPQGKYLASASTDGTMIIWNTGTWEPLLILENQLGRISTISWSPQGKYLASASFSGTVIIWDTVAWEPLTTLDEETEQVLSMTWSPHEERLATASLETIRIWEVGTWRKLISLEAHSKLVHSVAWSPQGKYLASASEDNTIIIWNVRTWESIATLEDHLDWVLSVAWSRNGAQLASASADNTVIIWDTKYWEKTATLKSHSGFVRSVDWSPNTERLASASADSTIIIWETASQESMTILEDHSSTIRNIAWSPNEKFLASASTDGKAIVWDAKNWEPLSALEDHSLGLGTRLVSTGQSSRNCLCR